MEKKQKKKNKRTKSKNSEHRMKITHRINVSFN